MPQVPVYQVLAQSLGSDRHTVHEIRLGADGCIYCTCTAWRMKQGRASCKHLDEHLLEQLPRRRSGPREDLGWNRIQLGDIIECNSRGVVFLLKVDTIDEPDDRVQGVQILDPGQHQQSLRAERMVHIRDVVRVVVHRRR